MNKEDGLKEAVETILDDIANPDEKKFKKKKKALKKKGTLVTSDPFEAQAWLDEHSKGKLEIK